MIYKGITIERAPINAYGFRWRALVSFPRYAGYLRADTQRGMRELINHYCQP